MTDETGLDLEAIRRRVEAATPGPWVPWVGGQVFIHPTVPSPTTAWGGDPCVVGPDGEELVQTADDVRFIAHARQDIPTLLAEVERLREDAEIVAVVDDLGWRDRLLRFRKRQGGWTDPDEDGNASVGSTP